MTATLSAPTRTGSTAPPQRRARRRGRRGRLAAWLAVAAFGGFALLPIYWLLATSFTPSQLTFAYPPSPVPRRITLDNFAALAENPQLLRYLVNSVVVSVVTAVLSVIVAAYMAYAFSKYRFRGRRSLMSFVLSSQLFPQALLLITLYELFDTYHLLNTYAAMVLSFTTFTLPLCVWMLKGFFDTIDDTLIEAAKIDRASQLRIIHSIVLPISAPGLVAAGLFAFVRGWNDFIFALTLAGPERQTLPPGLVNTFVGEASAEWAPLMAASLVTSIPVVVAFIALQRYLVGGIAAGAVKG
ncbi:MAG: carbohydrate ABC transporter permease [Micromonosporaceae bacterium]